MVEARRNPDYLRDTAQAVEAFRDALEEFLKLHEVNEAARGLAPAVFPRDGVEEQELASLRRKIARASGRAGQAVALTGAYVMVEGLGPIDPIAAWHSMTQPKPVLEPDDVVGACEQILGRLEAMVAEAEASAPPMVGAEAMHPLVWNAAARLWRDGHYRQAVAAAAEYLIHHVKMITGRNDLAETALWQETFSVQPPVLGKPRLRWPGNLDDRDVKNMNDGLRQFAPGVQMLIRNAASHGPGELGEQVALERLAVLSLLARWVDECALAQAPQPGTDRAVSPSAE